MLRNAHSSPQQQKVVCEVPGQHDEVGLRVAHALPGRLRGELAGAAARPEFGRVGRDARRERAHGAAPVDDRGDAAPEESVRHDRLIPAEND